MSQTLAERIAAAANAATAARSSSAAVAARKHTATPKTRKPATSPSPQPPTTKPASANKTPPAETAPKKAPKTAKRGGGNLSPARISSALTATIRAQPLTEAQREGLKVALRGMSIRPGALAQLEDDVLESLEAVVSGAKVPGPAGHGDRMTLFKLVGLPLHAGSQTTGKGDVGRALNNLTAAIERAHQRGARHVHATIDAEIVEEGPPNGPFEGYPQKMGSLVRMPGGTPEPVPMVVDATADGAAEGEGGATSPAADPPSWSLPDFLRGG